MPPKRQFTYLKEARKLAKLRKIETKSKTLVEDISFLFEDKFTEGSWIPKNNISYHKNYNWKEDNKFIDDMEIMDDDEDILDMDIFTKLFRATQGLSKFEDHQTPFLRGPHLSK